MGADRLPEWTAGFWRLLTVPFSPRDELLMRAFGRRRTNFGGQECERLALLELWIACMDARNVNIHDHVYAALECAQAWSAYVRRAFEIARSGDRIADLIEEVQYPSQ